MTAAATALTVVGLVLLPGSAAATRSAPSPIWGVTIVHAARSDVGWQRIATLRSDGINSFVVDARRSRRGQVDAFRKAAKKRGISLLAFGDAGQGCGSCLRTAASMPAAIKAARSPGSVVVHLQDPSQVHGLRNLRTGHVIAIVALQQSTFDAQKWRTAIGDARANSHLDLVVAPVGSGAATAFSVYLELLHERSAPPAAPSAGSGKANLWIDANGGSCTRDETRKPYVDTHACGTFDAAYQAARPGDVVLIKGGTYPSQKILDRPNLPLGSAPIVFHPAPAEDVKLNVSLEIYAHDFVLDGGDTVGVNEANRITIPGGDGPGNEEALGMRDNETDQQGQHRGLVVEDVHARNVKTSSDYSILRYSEIGPSDMGTGNLCSDLVQSAAEPTIGWVIEYNIVHDNRGDGCGGAHIDAFDLYLENGVVRGNRIWWCGTQCIFTGDPGSMLIEDNMIEETNACGDGCDAPGEVALMGTNTVRYNTIEGSDGYGRDPDRAGNSTIYGNLFLTRHDNCGSRGVVQVAYDHNVFPPGSNCGSNAKYCVPRLADGRLYTNTDRQADYHLATTDTCAIGAGDPGRVVSLDLDEATRPQCGAADAGADERCGTVVRR